METITINQLTTALIVYNDDALKNPKDYTSITDYGTPLKIAEAQVKEILRIIKERDIK